MLTCTLYLYYTTILTRNVDHGFEIFNSITQLYQEHVSNYKEVDIKNITLKMIIILFPSNTRFVRVKTSQRGVSFLSCLGLCTQNICYYRQLLK